MDSTVIDGTNLENIITVRFNADAIIENFYIIGKSQEVESYGIATIQYNIIANNCRVKNAQYGIVASSIQLNNFIIKKIRKESINLQDPFDSTHSSITNSLVIVETELWFNSIYLGFGGAPKIENNIIISEEGNVLTGIEADAFVNPIIRNNLVLGFNDQNIGSHSSTDTTLLINNISSYSQDAGIKLNNGAKAKLRNNIVSNNNKGISILNGTPNSDYNLFWRNNNDLLGLSYGENDVAADPMFVKDTIPNSDLNFDYHLQKYSPAIDAGDPDILDRDGSRSDIGLFGGPLGEIYTYLDLPPKTPMNFSYTFDSSNSKIRLIWDMNGEADFRNYIIYRDTIQGFTPDSTNKIAETDTSFFEDALLSKVFKTYYRITAVDSQQNESQPGEEIKVTLTDIDEPSVEIIRDYILYQNYPNPFNPNTKISYSIKERSYVKLMVYDIKGELISVLINQEQKAGYYEVEFPVRNLINQIPTDLSSGIYLYRIEVIGEGNIPKFSDMKKMILIK